VREVAHERQQVARGWRHVLLWWRLARWWRRRCACACTRVVRRGAAVGAGTQQGAS
jgi:hypothetical protein